MAWSTTPITNNHVSYWSETSITLPGSATTEYSSEINFLHRAASNDRYVTVTAVASAVSGTNVDISLYGALTSSGTKYLLAADITTAVTNAQKNYSGSVAIGRYPYPYYYIGHTADTDESANNISYYITTSID